MVLRRGQSSRQDDVSNFKQRQSRKKSRNHKAKEQQLGIRSVIHPNDSKQKELMDSIIDNDITIINGPPGSGKTLLSIYQLYQLLKEQVIDKIYIIRLITETNDEKLGALPGEKEDKLEHFAGPIKDNLSEFLPYGEIDYLFKNKLIEVMPVSHCRGRSFNNKGVIIEESQNLSEQAILTIATRIGDRTKLIFNGDDKQSDIYGRQGMSYLLKLFNNIQGAKVISFSGKQIVRHPIISSILERASQLSS